MSSITLRFLAESGSAPFGGKISGGTVMKWIDDAGYACATRWSRSACVTVSIGSLRFHHPILVGDLVEVEARMAYTGSTSMNLSIEVRAGDMKSRPMEVITECVMVFVAVDTEGKTIPVEPKRPETPGEVALAQHVRTHLNAARAALPGD